MSDRRIAAAVTTGELGGHGFSNQLHPRPAFLPIFDYPGVMRADALAKMAAVGSAHFRLQKRSSETYGWRHGHYVHVFIQSMGVLRVYSNNSIPIMLTNLCFYNRKSFFSVVACYIESFFIKNTDKSIFTHTLLVFSSLYVYAELYSWTDGAVLSTI